MGIYRQYQNGGVTSYYNAAATYNAGERIVYNYRSYESLVSSNIGNTPDTSPNDWLLVNESFIGMAERRLYQGKKLILEYALNKYFAEELSFHGYIGFRQPNNAFTPTPSDIYIETALPTHTSIILFSDRQDPNTLFSLPTGYYMFSSMITGTSSTYLFNIYVPVLVYASINADSTIADKIIRNFVDRYRIAGTNYNIITY
jgi:hypothetical protein